MLPMRSAHSLLLSSLLLAGCGGPEPAPVPAATPASPAGSAAPGIPSGHPPVDSPHGAPAAPRGGITADRFRAPEGWEPQAASGMRLLQFRLPRAEGDGKDGEVAVFANIMGSTKSNIDRWRGQFTSVVQGKDGLEEFSEGLKGKATLLDISGKYAAMAMPGAQHATPPAPEDARMIAAVVESPDGVYFVKSTGPPATMEKWARSVRGFILESAKR